MKLMNFSSFFVPNKDSTLSIPTTIPTFLLPYNHPIRFVTILNILEASVLFLINLSTPYSIALNSFIALIEMSKSGFRTNKSFSKNCHSKLKSSFVRNIL